MDGTKLFETIRFFIAQCTDSDRIKNLLIDNGATHINYLTEQVTHVIADANCPEAEEATELFDKPVVKSLWVHLCLKAGKVLPPEGFSLYNQFFSNIVATFSNDISSGDIARLAALITFNGGRVTKDLSAATHLIAIAPATSNGSTYTMGPLKQVDPGWVLDSVRQNILCDETLYDPSLLLGPPPPRPPTPSPPPPVVVPPQPTSQQQQQQHMIETDKQTNSQTSDIHNKNQAARPSLNQSNEEQARKIDHYPSQIRTQNPSPFSNKSQQQSHQVNTMPTPPPPPHQNQMTRPRMTSNVIRGASPRFRSSLPPGAQRPQQQAQQPMPRVMMIDQQQRAAYNNSYRKPSPYPINPEMQHMQQPHHQHPHPHHPQQSLPNQVQQPYQQVEHAQLHPHGGPVMNQQMRMTQPNMYHQQVRPTYPNSHMSPRMQVIQQNPMNPQQMQPQPVQRFQDPGNQMPQQRPYQINVPQQQQQQQHQSVNPNYQQGNMIRQPIYYNQNPNNMQVRMAQPGQMVRGPMMPSDHMITEPQHRYPQNQHQTQQPMYPQQHQSMQRAPLQPQQLKSQQFQPPQPPNSVQLQQQHLQPNMPGPNNVRGPRNQTDMKTSSARQSSATPRSDNLARTAPPNEQQPPHPSVFDAQIKSKVPVLTNNIEYHNFETGHITAKDQPFLGCRFQLIEHKEVDPKVRQNWCQTIVDAGGVFEENVEKLTHLICESRLSPIFTTAIKSGVRCVTIYWINDVLRQDRLEYPWKALHIPTCFAKQDKHLKDQIISITNLKGKDRREVVEMIKKTGAKYTDYFCQSNTLLICGSPGGEKFERAIEWRIPIANCLLISEFLIGGRNFSSMLAHAKYQNFNGGDQLRLDSYDLVQGLMVPWTKPIPIPAMISSNETMTLLNGTAKDSSAANLNDDSGVPKEGSGNSDLNANKTTTTNQEKATDMIETNTDDKGQMQIDKTDAAETISEETKMNIETTTIDNQSTPNATDITPSKAESSTFDTPTSESTKDEKTEFIPTDVKQIEKKQEESKKFRTSKSPVRILFTQLNNTLVKELGIYAKELGLSVVSNPLECTHLVIDQITRSEKFICAFSHASFILSYKWLVESHEYGQTLDETAYIIQDEKNEEKYSFNLAKSLLKRRKRGHLLFENFVFFVTPSVLQRIRSMAKLIESAGGQASTSMPSKAQISALRADGKRFVVVTERHDLHLLSSLESCHGVEMVRDEFIVSGILRQELNFVDHRLRTPILNGNQQGLAIEPSAHKRLRQS